MNRINDYAEYLHEQGIKVRYMHSDIDTLERIEILRDLRLGTFDVLVWAELLLRSCLYLKFLIKKTCLVILRRIYTNTF